MFATFLKYAKTTYTLVSGTDRTMWISVNMWNYFWFWIIVDIIMFQKWSLFG